MTGTFWSKSKYASSDNVRSFQETTTVSRFNKRRNFNSSIHPVQRTINRTHDYTRQLRNDNFKFKHDASCNTNNQPGDIKSNSRFYSESHSKANSKHVTSSKKYRRSRFGPKTSAVQRSCPDVTFRQREFSTGWRSRASDRRNINSRNARRRCNKKSSLKYFATECQEKEAIGGRSGPGRGRGEDSRPGREDLGEANNGCKKSTVGQVEQVDPIERPSLERKLGSSVCGGNRSGPICPPYVFKAPVSDDGEAGNGDKSVINNGYFVESRVAISCSKSEVFLCMDPCFEQYHENIDTYSAPVCNNHTFATHNHIPLKNMKRKHSTPTTLPKSKRTQES